MKKPFLLFALIFLFTTYTFAQTQKNFSGDWALDVSKSKLDEKMLVKAIDMNVVQTAESLTVETTIERNPPPEGVRLTISGGSGTAVYPLNGKEITVERESFRGKIPVKVKGEILPDGKLSLSSSRMGLYNNVEALSIGKDIWELSDDGKTLKISRTNINPVQNSTTEMIFTRK